MKNISADAPTQPWFEIAIPTHAGRVDLVTGALSAAGITATEVREPRPGSAEVVVYLRASTQERAREEARRIVAVLPGVDPGDVVVRRSLDESVWTENWRQHFAPIPIGERLLVVPPWARTSVPGRVTIVINPGAAFGTGRHETTSLCLAAIERLLPPGGSVADVGCGSGILAIAAARLGAAEVVATDIDPAAVEATRENAEANGVAAVVTAQTVGTQGSRPLADRRFDLVVANIYSDTLVAMAAELAGALSPGGHVVLSGIEAVRTGGVEAAFLACKLELVSREVAGEWAALVFRRPRA